MATLLLDRADLEVRIADGALALYENGTRSQTKVPRAAPDRPRRHPGRAYQTRHRGTAQARRSRRRHPCC